MEKQFDSTYKENHLVLDGNTLTIESLFRVAYHNIPVSLAESSINKIVKCREMVESKIESGEIVYGINTGIGEFSETILDNSQIEDFQKFLIYNHAAGIGEPAPIEYIRAAMLSRVNVHANGNSGCRLVITQTLTIVLLLLRVVNLIQWYKSSVIFLQNLDMLKYIPKIVLVY